MRSPTALIPLLLSFAALGCGVTPPPKPVILETLSEGRGAPVVMLGGGTGGAAGFAPHAGELSKQFRVIRIESIRMSLAQRGQPLPAGYSIDAESAALAATLHRIGVTEPVHLVGHSFGALVALDFALDHPGRVRSLVLAEPPAFWAVAPEELRSDPQMRAMLELTRGLPPASEPTDEQLTRFQTILGKPDATPPPPGTPARDEWDRKRRALRGLSAVPDHADDVRRLRTLRRPVLIVTGKTTVPFHRRINDILAGGLPDAGRVELDGGHAAPATDVRAFVAALRAFFERHRCAATRAGRRTTRASRRRRRRGTTRRAAPRGG